MTSSEQDPPPGWCLRLIMLFFTGMVVIFFVACKIEGYRKLTAIQKEAQANSIEAEQLLSDYHLVVSDHTAYWKIDMPEWLLERHGASRAQKSKQIDLDIKWERTYTGSTMLVSVNALGKEPLESTIINYQVGDFRLDLARWVEDNFGQKPPFRPPR